MFRRVWPRLGFWLRAVLATAGAFLLLVTFTPLVSWAGGHLCGDWSVADHGVLIVLAGDDVAFPGPEPNRAIGMGSYWRAMEAIYLWRHSHFSQVLLSGAYSGDTIKPVLEAYGIPENASVVEDRSRNTRENALDSQPILTGMSAPYVLLTSDYHMYRASRVFAKAGIRVVTMPAPDLLKRTNSLVSRWQCFWDLAAECARIAYYRFEGWI